MKLAVVAFPSFDDADRQWIESFRTKHDPQVARIGVHFTLVFPLEASPEDVGPEIATAAQSAAPIAFTVRRAEAIADAFGHGSHVFLVPDEGAAQISALHDRLYAGTLRAHHRSDIPFVPHMTVGTAPDSASALILATTLDVRARSVRGTVDALDLLDVEPPCVRSMATYQLTGEHTRIR